MLRAAVGIVLTLILIYGAAKAWPLVRGPFIEITIPIKYTTSPDGFVSLAGIAHNAEALFLNGGPLLTDLEGRFSTTLLLPPGNAILTLTATDRFGRQTTERRTVYVSTEELDARIEEPPPQSDAP